MPSVGREPVKTILLPILGRSGAPKALEPIRAALNSNDNDRYEAAVRAYSNWPVADVAEDLLKLAKDGRKPGNRIEALRAFARVIAVRDENLNNRQAALEKLQLLKRAMPLAERNDERAVLLERAAGLRHVETLRFVVPYLDRPELAQQASRTVVELAHHRDLRDPDKAEFLKALDKVIAVSKDAGVVERAKDYKADR
jgi:hypothetical protein